MAPVSDEDNIKMLISHHIFNNDVDKVASYMGITKNAVNKRMARLIADEKAIATKNGFLEGGAPTKKRPAGKKSKKEGEASTEFTQDEDGKEAAE